MNYIESKARTKDEHWQKKKKKAEEKKKKKRSVERCSKGKAANGICECI